MLRVSRTYTRWAAPVTCNWVFPFSLRLFYLFFTPKPTGAWRRQGFKQRTVVVLRQQLLWRNEKWEDPLFFDVQAHKPLASSFFANGADTMNEIIRLWCDCHLLSSFFSYYKLALEWRKESLPHLISYWFALLSTRDVAFVSLIRMT